MSRSEFFACCRSALNALRADHLEEAHAHLENAYEFAHIQSPNLQDSRQKILLKIQALINRRSVSTASYSHYYKQSHDVSQRENIPNISIVTTVFNRFWQLRQTLGRNLEVIRDQADVEMVLVDFGGPDSAEIQNFIEANFVGDLLCLKLKYYIAKEPSPLFRVATAKNVAHRLSLGRFIFSLDVDNFLYLEDLEIIRNHLHFSPGDILHQTTGPAPMRHKQWIGYQLHEDQSAYHNDNVNWDGSIGRIGLLREAFERVNGYDENFQGMGMEDIDLIMRVIKTGSVYHHISINRSAQEVYIDNGTASDEHEHSNNRDNWRIMDDAIAAGRFFPYYKSTSPLDKFKAYVPAMVKQSANARVTLFSSLFKIEAYIDRFLNDLYSIKRTPGVCVWLLDILDSNSNKISQALSTAADGHTVFYVPVRYDPGLYALWNMAIASIQSPLLGNLNADDLRGPGWLQKCLDPLEAGTTDVASPFTVPFNDEKAIDYSATMQAIYANNRDQDCWFKTRCRIRGEFPLEEIYHEPLSDGIYCHEDLFQVLSNGCLSSYCIPNASAIWRRSIHFVVGNFDEKSYGCFADLAMWAKAGARGFRFRLVNYPALFFVSPEQAHRRLHHDEFKLLALATSFGSPALRNWLGRRHFDLSKIGGTYGDHHFKGWNWVRDNVNAYFKHTKPRVLLDMFVERTFFWPDAEISSEGAAVDESFYYQRPWLGFVHTTPHECSAYSDNAQNLIALLNHPGFIKSLPVCRGLVVLSRENQIYINDYLSSSYELNLPVFRLFHPNIPVDSPQDPCTIDLGPNSERFVFHIGWHLRSFSAFARIRLDRSQKVLLVPKGFPVDYFINEIVNKELRLSGMAAIEEYVANIYTASQSDYVHILQKGIIYNHYIQPAGSNLLSECITAKAHLVLNRHKAFEEYLGADYPLFYDSLEEADELIRLARSGKLTETLRSFFDNALERFSVDKFCRELERIGHHIYSSM